MDFRPIPPSGQVQDLRNQKPKTEEDVKNEKEQRSNKIRRNLRIFALVLAGYYFASGGWSWYQESQREAAAANSVTNEQNPLKDPVQFRNTFNKLLVNHDTSLPTANANDSTDGFIAVLSTTVEMQGYAKPNSHELQEIQIQTRYPDAFPPESIVAFRTFVLACEQLANPQATQADADAILNSIGLVPEVDANENDKHFDNLKFNSQHYQYSTVFTSGPIDELTLMATPLVNINTQEGDVPTLETAAQQETAVAQASNDNAQTNANEQALADNETANQVPTDAAIEDNTIVEEGALVTDDVPELSEPSVESDGDVPTL